MTTMRKGWMAVLVLAIGAFAAGCEDTPLTAGSDWTMNVTANPGSVSLDPNTGSTSTDVDLAATVLDSKGIPQSGVALYFTASIPGLIAGKKGVKTDAAGIAHDTLQVTLANVGAAASITATANSAAVSKTVTIPVTTNALNKPPVASIVASPPTDQAAGGAVVFDGSTSADPDATDRITMYRWVVTSTNPDDGRDNPIIAEGPGVSALAFPSDPLPTFQTFQNIQDLTVSLSVTDDPNAPALLAAGTPIAYRAQKTLLYSIVTVRADGNTAPTALLAGADQQQIFGLPRSPVSFQLDGSLSSDPETPIDIYDFSRRNGSAPTPRRAPSKVTCSHLVDAVPRTYTAALTVVDEGTGRIDASEQFECRKTSAEKTINVTVSPLASGG